MLQDIIDETNDKIKAELTTNAYTKVTAKMIGLSSQVGGDIWISEDDIVIKSSAKASIDYYGGFEYVRKDYVTMIGDYVVYSIDDSRILDCIEFYFESIGE